MSQTSFPNPGTGADGAFVVRPFPRLITILWFLALGYGLFLSWQPLLDHLAYYERYGASVYSTVLAGLAALGVALPLYQWVRQRFFWRHELLILAAVPLLACLFRAPRALFVVLWILLACYLFGRYVVERLGLEVEGPVEEISLSTTVGLAALIGVLFVLGLAGGYYWWALALLFATPCVLLRNRMRPFAQQLRSLHEKWGGTEEFRGPAFAIVVVFVLAFSAITCLVALTPSLSYDAKLFHVPSIRFYAASHALKPLPYVNYSYYPQGAEIVQSAAFNLGGQYAAQLLTPCVFAITLLLAYGILHRTGAGRATSVGALAFALSVPVLHWTGSVIKNDMFVALFQAAALYCVIRAWKGGSANWLRLGAFCFATSFGIKHVALFGGVALGVIVLIELFRRPKPFRLAVSLTLIFLVFGTYWHARTYLATGNPVFPKRVTTASRQAGPVNTGILKENDPGRLSYLQTFHFKGRMVFDSATSNPLGMFLVLCWTVWLWVRRRERSVGERLCLVFCALYLLYWGWIWGILRYAILPVLLLFALTGVRFISFAQQSGRAIRWSAYGATAYALAFSLLVVGMIHEVSLAQLRLFAGRTDEAEFLRTVEADYAPLEFLSGVLEPGESIMGIRNCARAYAPALTPYFCAGLGGWGRRQMPERVGRHLREGEEWDYVIVPRARQDEFFEVISTLRRATLVYEDRFYLVLRLEPLPAA